NLPPGKAVTARNSAIDTYSKDHLCRLARNRTTDDGHKVSRPDPQVHAAQSLELRRPFPIDLAQPLELDQRLFTHSHGNRTPRSAGSSASRPGGTTRSPSCRPARISTATRLRRPSRTRRSSTPWLVETRTLPSSWPSAFRPRLSTAWRGSCSTPSAEAFTKKTCAVIWVSRRPCSLGTSKSAW